MRARLSLPAQIIVLGMNASCIRWYEVAGKKKVLALSWRRVLDDEVERSCGRRINSLASWAGRESWRQTTCC